MKNKILALFMCLFTVVFVACDDNNVDKLLDDIDSIVEVSMISTVKENTIPEKNVVSNADAQMIVEQLKKYEYKYISDTQIEGFEYFFNIFYNNKNKEHKTISIAFCGANKVMINSKLYQVSGYDKKDFKDIS